jgi:hypothetical protein
MWALPLATGELRYTPGAFRAYRRLFGIYWLIDIGKVAALRCLTQFCLKTCPVIANPEITRECMIVPV